MRVGELHYGLLKGVFSNPSHGFRFVRGGWESGKGMGFRVRQIGMTPGFMIDQNYFIVFQISKLGKQNS